MKMRKKLAALLAVAMIASVMPMTAFAASKNTINKVINVKEGEDLTSDAGVKLVIELQPGHELEVGESFELNLADAEWDSRMFTAAYLGGSHFDLQGRLVGSANAGPHAYTLSRQSETTLIVTAVAQIINTFSVPLVANVTGGTPKLAVNSYGTAVSSSEITFVNATTGKAIVTVGKTFTIAKTEFAAPIVLDEPFVGAFKQKSSGVNRTFEIELRDNTFEINNAAAVRLVPAPGKGFVGLGSVGPTAASLTAFNKGDTNVLKFEIPSTAGINTKGGYILQNLEIRPLRDARAGDIQAIISGDLVDRQVVTLAKYGDYTTTLKVAKDDYSVVAGKEIDVKFTLSEDMDNAIIAGRKALFEFPKGVVLHDLIVTEKNTTGTVEWDYLYDKNGKRINGFEVTDFKPSAGRMSSYEFEAILYVEAGFTGDISLTAAGKAFADELEVLVAKTEAPVTFEGTGTTLKVGLQEQKTDATFTIKETAKHRIDQKEIVLSLGKDYKDILIKGSDVKVTEGDLEIEKVGYKDGKMTIEIKRFSSEPSTIEVKNMKFTTDRTIPEGTYNLELSGTAFTELVTTSKQDLAASPTKRTQGISSKVATLKEFIVIGTPNTEDITAGANRAEVKFVVGSDQHLINGEAETMDAPPYIKDGNTMVPVRYVATALGVDAEQVIWDQANQTATILADKAVQVKLGSKAMSVNGVNVPMNVAAELTNDRTFVPMGAIARALGVVVEWDNETKTATFNPAADK